MGPCAMLMTRMTPKMSARPSATMAYSAPARMPEMTTCPTIAGDSATFIGRPRRRWSARESGLTARELVGPHDDALALLPLEQHHLVGDLEAVLVHLVLAEHRARLQREQRVAHLVGVQRACLLHALGIEHAAGVPGRRMIAGLVLELLHERLMKLLGARVGQRGLPLR